MPMAYLFSIQLNPENNSDSWKSRRQIVLIPVGPTVVIAVVARLPNVLSPIINQSLVPRKSEIAGLNLIRIRSQRSAGQSNAVNAGASGAVFVVAYR